MQVFLYTYLTVAIWFVLSATSVKAVEYVNEFPVIPEFIQFIKTDFITNCKDGTVITADTYTFANQPGLIYLEAFRSPDEENPISVMYIDFGEEPDIDIYVKNMGRVEWYQSTFEFKEAYPNGSCQGKTTL